MAIHDSKIHVEDAEESLHLLKMGNQRYVEECSSQEHSHAEDREHLQHSQKPFATILTCSDSRVSPEIYFDQKLGGLFVVRNAGNVADETVLGSIEYAVEHLHCPLVVVVGHSSCGAVTAAMEGEQHSLHIQHILEQILSHCEPQDDVDAACQHHVTAMVEKIAENEVVKNEGALVLGAFYDISSGKVHWN